ncbi:hypothetical protein WJX74_007481 [Apatococcus lobatus]|uniref:Uncharacterized protein n=2 Tax=Apatococcus TaxID=904362 RepID=A0AAW1SQU8_9CHLO
MSRPLASKHLLAGKLCLVTGGSRGIGRAIAEAYAEQGAKLALVARTTSQLEETAESCRKLGAPEAHVFAVDLTDGKQLADLVKQLEAKFQMVNVLVNNAGMMSKSGSTPREGDAAEEEMLLKLNTLAPMRLTRLVTPKMVEAKEGLIVNVGSVAALEPMSSVCDYAASKWGLRGWSLSCHENLRKDNIKVVIIHPGMVRTDMTTSDKTEASAQKRMIQPTDIAEAALLAVRMSPSAVPNEITVRPGPPVFG